MILTKYFITQGFQSQRHTLFKKKKKENKGKKGKRFKYQNQIKETNYFFKKTYHQSL